MSIYQIKDVGISINECEMLEGADVEYSLHICKARGDYIEYFDDLGELKIAIANNLTEQEIASGVIDRLCNFPQNRLQDGCVENFWTDDCMSISIGVCASNKNQS